MRISFKYYPGGKKKALTMSYDDGQIHDRRLVDFFNRYGIKGTFHLNSGKLDTESFLNASEVKTLFEGHEVSSHTLNHPFLTMVPNETLSEEILEDRRRLEALVGYPVRGMSYPFGDYSEKLVGMLPCFGIEYSRTVLSHGRFHLPENFLLWHPTCHHDQNLIDKYKEFKSPKTWDRMSLLYVWGHSYEFDRNNNWEVIEEFCKAASGDESVWYATNIEILDYINAMRSLKFSAEGNIVFNPSAIPVWIDADDQTVKIEPGSTLRL